MIYQIGNDPTERILIGKNFGLKKSSNYMFNISLGH